MNFGFIKFFIASVYRLINENVKKLYFSTSYYNRAINVVPPTRSYDMNNIPLLEEILDKKQNRIYLVKKFSTNIWKIDNIGQNNIDELNTFSWLPSLDVKKDQTLVKEIIREWLKRYEDFDSATWSLKIISKRIIFLICCSHFTVRSHDLVFRNKVIINIIKQAFHLNNNIKLLSRPIDRVLAIASIILTSITFERYQK